MIYFHSYLGRDPMPHILIPPFEYSTILIPHYFDCVGKQVPATVDYSEGLIVLSYVLTVAGPYTAIIKINNLEVHGSSCRINVMSAAAAPAQSTLKAARVLAELDFLHTHL